MSCKKHLYITEQTKTKPQETLEFNLRKPVETCSFRIPLSLEDGEWLIRVTSLEVYNSIFRIIQENCISEVSKSIGEQKQALLFRRFEKG